MKIDSFDLILDKVVPENRRRNVQQQQQQFYLAGEEIKGNVELIVLERLRVARLTLRLVGTSYTGWHDEFIAGAAYEARDSLLEEYKDLTSDLQAHCNEASGEIPRGKHNIDFGMKLPIESVSSVEKPAYGHVKYTLVATLDVPEEGGDSEIVAEMAVPVRAFLTVDSPHFLNPIETTEQIFVIRPWLCTGNSRRWIRATLSVSSLGLLPGDKCTLTLTVENTVKKARLKRHSKEHHHCALISLCQQLDFRARSKQPPYLWTKRSITTAVHSCGTCKANCREGPERRLIAFHVPADLPPTSAKDTGLITCSYFFRIEAEEHLDVIVPVVIGSYGTLERSDQQQQETMENQTTTTILQDD